MNNATTRAVRRFLFTHDAHLEMLKATAKKLVMVAGYTTSDGRVIPAHQKMVHYDPDKTLAAVATGQGSHSQKKAHAKLAGKAWWQDMSVDEKAIAVMSLATDLQDAASQSAAVSGWKKVALQGKNPTPGQWAAFMAQPKLKQGELLALVQEQVGTGHLVSPSKPVSPDAAVAIEAQTALEASPPVPEPSQPPDTHADAVVALAAMESGPHYQKVALAKLKVDKAWQAKTPTEQHAQAMALYKELQSAASHSAALSTAKKALMAGKVPTKAQYDAIQSASADALGKFHAAVIEHISPSQYADLMAGAKVKHYGDGENAPANSGKAPVQPKKANTKAASNGPNEGDTKQGADGLLVLKDGRWQKMNVAKPAPVAKSGIQAMDGWQKVGGQQGSNEGGRYRDPSGVEWYVKFPKDPDAARAEVLAAKLYTLAGASAQDCKFVTRDGKLAIATRWVDLKKVTPKAMSKLDGVREFFAVDAWLGNHDVVGEDFSNIQKAADGKAHRVDAGGSLMFRAQGQKKAFGPSVDAIDSMRDPKYGNNHAVFGNMTKAEITASVKHVLDIPDDDIRLFCKKFGPGSAADREKLADTLIQRKADLRKRYPEAVGAPVYRVPSKPDFTNWHGPGKGLSSKSALNKQNDALAEQIHAHGLAHDKAGLKAMKYQPITEGGDPIGKPQSIGDHPSKHIKGYWQDVQRALETPHVSSTKQAKQQALKKKALHSDDIEDVGTLKEAPSAVGRYGVLGKLSAQEAESFSPEKEVSLQSDKSLHAKLYAAQKAAVASLPSLQKSAIKDYTGNKYHEVNQALVSGAPNDAAKNAATGVAAAAYTLPGGLVLSRRISPKKDSLTGGALDPEAFIKKLQEVGEGAVIKEFALCSTSLRSGVWNGSIHLRITCAEGVRGLHVGRGPAGGGLSKHPSEQEVILPEGTKYVLKKIHKNGEHFTDEHGQWGTGFDTVVELLALPN